ncbi:MAG: alginate lyase family protein [Bacteroidetes bacterium]|nr:alginate lyase family protein [Bacteroidota bacterium]
MKIKYFLLNLLFILFSSVIFAQNWQEIKTVNDVCTVYPEQMESMLGELNLDFNGLEKVKKAYQNGDIEKACTYLLEYYKNSNNAMHLRVNQPVKTTKTVALSDTVLNDVFVIQNVRGQVRYGNDGHRDWYYKGPNNDEEWAWLSNRHSQLSTVLSTYFETGNPKYAEYIDLFLRDFIIKSMPYPAVKSNTSVWRGLEVAARTKVWSRIFFGLLKNENLSPATQLLMLSSLPDHAHYNRNFHSGNNWLTMEISALATVATNFPEYKDSEEWLDYSMGTMIESMKNQVYPDGVQTELSSHYHNVSMSNFELFKNICDKANKKLPDFFNQTIEDMYAYLAHAMRPDGNRILNNDGDRGSDRNLILKGAKKFNNTEWEYIATNGESGTKPVNGPSWCYPWAGHLISRSGYDADAHWSFFDIGPWGSGHQHSDKLHLSISAYGKDLLVDAGRFAYTGEVARKFRQYARSSRAHNLVLLDGKVQNPGSKLAEKPLLAEQYKITDTFDYASGTFNDFNDIEGVGENLRTLFYVRGEFWIVVDKIKTDRPRKVETLWHWHPGCLVQKENRIVKTKNERGNLAIIPVSKQKFDIKFIEGQEGPVAQGWYSPEYNKYEPNVASIYSTDIESEETLVWLLVPSGNEVPEIHAKIILEKETEIKLEVITKERGSWKLTIPYQNSKKAKLEFN